MQLQTGVLKHMVECEHLGNKSQGGRENSTCFCFISLQKHVWDDIRIKDFLLPFPVSQHFSVLPHLLLLSHFVCSLAELLVGRMLSRHREQY